MFDVAPTELMLVAVVALLVIGPKDLPKAMRFVGHWVGKARGVARQFRSGFDTMVREAELQDMEKKWAAENERIMREHPQPVALPTAATDTVVDNAPHDPVTDDAPPVMTERPVVAPPPQAAPAAEPPVAIEPAVTESGEGGPPPPRPDRKRSKAAS